MRRACLRRVKWTAALAAAVATCAAPAVAQPTDPGKVEIPFDRYYDVAQTREWMEQIAAAYPELVTLRVVGKSLQGREIVVARVSAPGAVEGDRPAMWIDGNIHGNEIQASEVVLYTLWHLTKSYGRNERLTRILDGCTFYLAPMVNPDGRQFWLEQANTPHSSRQNHRPVDNDRDGKMDEDPPDDLDRDGQITTMWKEDAAGRWVRSQTDDRVFVRLRDDQTATAVVATYQYLGEEGIDNDGDGRVNEDGPFGDDMNRNWPCDWQPEHIQGGAGPFPLSAPETRGIAEFILAHPDIAAVQSYHNFGGMILRGPGAQYRERLYPGEDVRVYDELARTGEKMLPYYRYLVLFSGLYRVHGGFLTWASENAGAFSFTNELWSTGKYFQRDGGGPNEEQEWLWRDKIAFGELFSPYHEIEHPQYGKVLVGGVNKWSSRVTPPFMLAEECHRNFAFTMYHAEQTPRLKFGRVLAESVGNGVWRVRAEVTNTQAIPTRSALSARERIGWPDLLEAGPGAGGAVKVAAVNQLANWLDLTPSPLTGGEDREPGRLLVASGVPGRGTRVFEFIVEGAEGAGLKLRYTSQWAKTIETTVELRAPNPPGSPRP